jgi:hypothetical protein
MEAKKIAIIGVSSVVLLTGGFFLYRAIKNIIDSKNDEKNSPPDIKSSSSSSSSSSSKSSGSSSSSSSSSTTPKIPFKNKQEGDAFRKWVNEKYPAYAKQIDLSLSGSYNNSYITKAWVKYGDEYSKQGSASTSTSNSEWSSSDGSAQKELYDRLKEANLDVDYDYAGSSRWEWDTTNGYPTVYFQVYKGGNLVLEKQNKAYGNRYAKQNGSWRKSANGWTFTFGGKTYNAPYSGSGLINTLWGLMKDANYFSWSDSKFVPFDNEKKKRRNKSQMDILENNCDSLM